MVECLPTVCVMFPRFPFRGINPVTRSNPTLNPKAVFAEGKSFHLPCNQSLSEKRLKNERGTPLIATGKILPFAPAFAGCGLLPFTLRVNSSKPFAISYLAKTRGKRGGGDTHSQFFMPGLGVERTGIRAKGRKLGAGGAFCWRLDRCGSSGPRGGGAGSACLI